MPDHPDCPPLDYQELLGLEKMGKHIHPLGKLGIHVDIRQLLDGYEKIESRQQRNRDHIDIGEDGIPEAFTGNLTINKIYNNNQPVLGNHKFMSNNIINQ